MARSDAPDASESTARTANLAWQDAIDDHEAQAAAQTERCGDDGVFA